MSLLKKYFHLLIFQCLIASILSQKNYSDNNQFLSLNPLFNITINNSENLFHSKFLQTVHSNFFSKNYYYTILYLGPHHFGQPFIIDTGSSIMTSPFCSINIESNNNKSNKKGPLKCNSNICKLVPADVCLSNSNKFLGGNICSFNIKKFNGDGIKGYYIKDYVYFETDIHNYSNILFNLRKKIFISYSLPIGCTLEEEGKYKYLNNSGILGMNNSPHAIPNLLYNLGIIKKNIFTLCFSLNGGYMSLGEIETKYHKSRIINYIPFLNSNLYYFVKLNSLKIENNETNIIKVPLICKIDSGRKFSYFPSKVLNQIISQFDLYFNNKNFYCDNFLYEDLYGYCASFPEKIFFYLNIFKYLPKVILSFGDKEYIWNPINYFYYFSYNISSNIKIIKFCFGFLVDKSERVTFGANFFHGYDIIFNRAEQKLGFVEADCYRNNLIETQEGNNFNDDLNNSSNKRKFNLVNNNYFNNILFIQGNNTELDNIEFYFNNSVIILLFIIILIVVIIIVLLIFLCRKKKLKTETKNEYIKGIKLHENNQITENKISFEENNNNDNSDKELEENKVL